MDFKQLFTEDRGVSPVIGVILMVAITVILAAVIGAFVLGLGDNITENPPQSSFEFDFNGSTDVEITHGGGEDFERDTVTVSIDGQTVYENGRNHTWTNSDEYNFSNGTLWEDPVQTGDTLTLVNETSNADVQGETIRIVWNNPSGGSSNVIGERDWPN